MHLWRDPAIERTADLLTEIVLARPVRTPAACPASLRVSGDRLADEERAEAELEQATAALTRPAPAVLRLVV